MHSDGILVIFSDRHYDPEIEGKSYVSTRSLVIEAPCIIISLFSWEVQIKHDPPEQVANARNPFPTE